MHELGFLNSKCDFPKPASLEKVKLGLELWLENADLYEKSGNYNLANFSRQMTKDFLGQKILKAIFGNSPFLTSIILKDTAFFQNLIKQGPDLVMKGLLEEPEEIILDSSDDKELAKYLRITKRRTALTVALADITGTWSLKRVTGALSDFASFALRLAAIKVLKNASNQGYLTLKYTNNPEQESGLIIIAMGKLGARELNYSRDIDLIILFDPNRIKSDKPQELQKCFVRLTKNLVRIIDERTQDGYVFRTDLRLRPDPSVTPIAISVTRAEIYYESLGQNWERAAMIKARAIAGDIEAGEAFIKRLKPFIWRKNLDFAAIKDIQSIKRQIHAHRGGAIIKMSGHNIKLGRGGIREIEFFAQTQQLIWGGRLSNLRSSVTCKALIALANNGNFSRNTANDLIEAYEFLRRLEHRLQMVNDEQTQVLPKTLEEIRKIGVFMGFSRSKDFTSELTNYLATVQKHYGNLYDDTPTLSGSVNIHGEEASNLVFTGAESDPETLTTLRTFGFKEPKTIDNSVRGWHHGRVRATHSKRAREILTELMPVILKAIGKTPAPDIAFLRFDKFLSKLPAGVQLFSMFQANLHLLDLVAEIMGKAPRLADHLSRCPAILDSVLTQDFFNPPPEKPKLARELFELLDRSEYFEEKLDISRRWKNDRHFQVGVQCLDGTIQPRTASLAYSNIAEAAIISLFPIIEQEFAKNHGHLPDSNNDHTGLAVLALGKLGSREITASSDLDLVFVYNNSKDNILNSIVSDGDQPLSTIQYYNRLSQRLINGLSALTSEGQLYKVDMRLRPSGSNGLIATSLKGFERYHTHSAWTWEHLALTRARIVTGPPELCNLLTNTIGNILKKKRDKEALVRDVANMRKRLDTELHTDCIFALKYLRGGLLDIEFIVQYLTLKHAAKHPEILGLGTRSTLTALLKANLLPELMGLDLTEALDLWQDLQGLLGLTIEGDITIDREEEISKALKKDLVRVASNFLVVTSGDIDDFEQLKNIIIDRADKVYSIFCNLIEIPAANLSQMEI
jgi:glutamate-ammonia-ligase adenylyltransferase